MGDASYTPVLLDPITADTAYSTEWFWGVIIATNGTASTTHLRAGQTAGAGTILATFIIEAVTGGTTRPFMLPGPTKIQGGFNIDVDANVTRATVVK